MILPKNNNNLGVFLDLFVAASKVMYRESSPID